MIKDEKLLNIILNDIAIDEKENVNNLPDCRIGDQEKEKEYKEKSFIEMDDKDQMQEDISFRFKIKPHLKEYPCNKLTDDSAMVLLL